MPWKQDAYPASIHMERGAESSICGLVIRLTEADAGKNEGNMHTGLISVLSSEPRNKTDGFDDPTVQNK